MDGQTNLVQVRCTDGKEYAIRAMMWNLARIDQAWEKWKKHHILSDDLPTTVDGFTRFVVANGSMWFEAVDLESGEQVGLIYLNDMLYSITKNRFTQATMHAVMWDAKFAPRRDLGKKFLAFLFYNFKFHRIQAEIPLKFGGAIRAMKSMGFQVEGTLRKARQFGGEWYNVLVLGLLEDEIDDGFR